MPPRPRSRALSFGSVALPALLALVAAGCQTTQSADTTGGIGLASSSAASEGGRGEGEPRREVDLAAAAYRANPGNPRAAIRYAEALRGIGERPQASAVLEQASIRHPNDRAVLGAYGRALADAGNYSQAFDVLGRAHTPDQPDWRVLSVQGAALDQMGRHERRAAIMPAP